MPDVYLLAEGRDGESAVPHLTLRFLDTGLVLEQSDGQPLWQAEWTELARMAPVARSVLPDGRYGVVVLVAGRGRGHRHQVVLTTDDVATTEAEVRARARAHGLRTRAPAHAVPRGLIAGVVVAGVGTLTLLLLSAAHVVHF